MEKVVALAIFALALVAYAAMIYHAVTSPRTAPNMKVFWGIAIAVTGLMGYFIWWMMSPARPKLESFASVEPQPDVAIVRVGRSSFFGALVKYCVYLDDDRTTPVASIRGRGQTLVSVTPGSHTLRVKGWRWLDFPFEAHAGEVLAFSLDTKAETPLTNTVAGWVAAEGA